MAQDKTRHSDYERGYLAAIKDAEGCIEKKLPHYGEAYERLLMDVRDDIGFLSHREFN